MLALFLCFGLAVSAQSNQDSTRLKGRIIDERAEPIPGAFIELFYDGKSVTGTATDEDGNFKVIIKKPQLKNDTRLLLKTMYSSYNTATIKLTQSNISQNHIVQLTVNTKELIESNLPAQTTTYDHPSYNIIEPVDDRTCTIVGIVYDEKKEPIPGVLVSISDNSSAKFNTASDENGVYILRSVPHGGIYFQD